jgi:rhamnose transport system permease protein
VRWRWENRGGISSVLRKARERGIKSLRGDADARSRTPRDFFVNRQTPEGIANTLTDEAGRLLAAKGSSLSSSPAAERRQPERVDLRNIRNGSPRNTPALKLADVIPSSGRRSRQGVRETQTILRVYPAVKLGHGHFAPAVSRIGGSGASSQSRGGEVNVIGLSLPNINKPYVPRRGSSRRSSLWNTRDLGYLTGCGRPPNWWKTAFSAGARSIDAGRLGTLEVRGFGDHSRRAAADEQGQYRSIRFFDLVDLVDLVIGDLVIW